MDPVATHLARVVEMQTAQLDRLTYLIGQMHGVFRDELDTLDQRIVQLDEELSHYRQCRHAGSPSPRSSSSS